MNMRADILTGYVMLVLLACPAFCQGADDARKHLVRGMAAIEMAKGEEELFGAADEFKRATEIAPDLAAAWYNLGSVQAKLGQIKDAIASYQRYLQLAPGAEDSRRVGDEIIKLEYRLEKAVAFQTKSGQWLDKDGTFYTLTTAKDKLEIRGNHFRSRDDIEYRDVMIFNFGAIGDLGVEKLTIRLELRGSKLSGSWEVPAGKISSFDRCILPAEKGEAEGVLDDRNNSMVLRLVRAKYKVVQVEPPVFGDKYCEEVSIIETRPVELVLSGPLPTGGVRSAGLNSSGNFTINTLDTPSNEQSAGLKEGDEIISIDGVSVQQLGTPVAKIRALHGKIGSVVRLSVLRGGGLFSSAETKNIEFIRSDISK